MPLIGTGTVSTLAEGRTTVTALDAAPIAAPGSELLHVMCEVARAGALEALPPGLHPQNPPTLSLYVLRAPDTEVGPITLAQVGLASRSGTWPCNYLLATVVQEAAAAEALSERWGDRCVLGDVTLQARNDRVAGSAAVGGSTVLDILLHTPIPISPGDVAYYSNINLAETPRGTELVYYERSMHVQKADRGRPEVRSIDLAALGHEDVSITATVSASYVRADVTIGPLLMVSNPEVAGMADFEMLNLA